MILSLQGIFTLMPVAYFQFYSPPLSPHDLRNYRGPPAVYHWPTPGSPMDSAWEMGPGSSSTPNSTGGRRRLWPRSYMDSPGPYPMYCLVHQVQRKDWTFVTFRKCLLNFFLSWCAWTVFEMVHFFHFLVILYVPFWWCTLRRLILAGTYFVFLHVLVNIHIL